MNSLISLSWLSAVSEDARFICCTEFPSRHFIEASNLSSCFLTSHVLFNFVTYSVCCSAMSDGREMNGVHKIGSFVCGNWRRVASPCAIPTFIPNDRPILHRTISLWCPRDAKIYISVYFMLFIRQKMNTMYRKVDRVLLRKQGTSNLPCYQPSLPDQKQETDSTVTSVGLHITELVRLRI